MFTLFGSQIARLEQYRVRVEVAAQRLSLLATCHFLFNVTHERGLIEQETSLVRRYAYSCAGDLLLIVI